MGFVFRWLVLLATGVVAAAVAGVETPLTAPRSALAQWVETRQLVSKTRSEWQTEKEALEQSIALYERELKTLQEQSSKVATNSVQVADERAEAESLKRSSEEALTRARDFATSFEKEIRQRFLRWPAPLQDLVKKDLARMPEDPAATKMLAAERVQLVVGILNEVDKFNNAVNLFNEKRTNAKGEEVAVETVYVGLGAAYFVSGPGDFAGVGIPGANGWEWVPKPEIASAVKEVIKIYRNERTATFVRLPVSIQ